MKILKQLLSKGYLPKEVPPSFSTSDFAEFVTHKDVKVKDFLVAPNFNGTLKPGRTGISNLCKHTLGMLDNTSRSINVPHPVQFYYLCEALDSGWDKIKEHLSKSELSISTPETKLAASRAFVPEKTGRDRVNHRIEDRVHGDFLVVADVASCYGSIYTHSIPWALHSKTTAKANRTDFSLIGNLLDSYVRNGQDSQTIGIPVGTDTSFIIAEIVLTAVDIKLQSKHPGIKGFRFFDDYEIVCSDYFQARQILADLEASLAEYELTLSRRKTSISPLPTEIDYPWLTELRKFDFESYETRKPLKQREMLMDFANTIFTLAKKFPKDPVLRYALVTVASEPLNQYDWGIYQNLLIQIYRSQSQVSHLIAHELLTYKERYEESIDEELLTKAISDHVVRYTPTRATNEVAWALWLAILFEITLSQKAADHVSESTDNFVAILAMDGKLKGMFPESIDSTSWERRLIEENIYSEDWLLAYEFPAQGWKKVQDTSDYINQHQCLSKLHNEGICFYDGGSYSRIDDLLEQLQIRPEFYAS